VAVNAVANAAHGPRIDMRDGPVSAWVVPTNEEIVIARHTRDALRLAPAVVPSGPVHRPFSTARVSSG
jgi:hypothetical protein